MDSGRGSCWTCDGDEQSARALVLVALPERRRLVRYPCRNEEMKVRESRTGHLRQWRRTRLPPGEEGEGAPVILRAQSRMPAEQCKSLSTHAASKRSQIAQSSSRVSTALHRRSNQLWRTPPS